MPSDVHVFRQARGAEIVIVSVAQSMNYNSWQNIEFILTINEESNEQKIESKFSEVKNIYESFVKECQMEIFSGYNITSTHRFFKETKSKSEDIGPKTVLRISSEFSSLKSNLPNNWDTYL